MVYQWKFPLNLDAQVAGEELARIEHKHNCLSSENVLEESRAETAVLHNLFEWNDSVAAEKYRLEQARFIIRNIVVTVELPAQDNAQQVVKVRGYVNVSETQKGEYVTITTALNNDDYKKRVLKNAAAELLAFQAKYQTLSELADVFTSINDFVNSFN